MSVAVPNGLSVIGCGRCGRADGSPATVSILSHSPFDTVCYVTLHLRGARNTKRQIGIVPARNQMENGTRAAIRRFPLKALEIRRVALANADFRSLCEDLADAEAAFDRCVSSADADKDKRRSEYQILKEELAIEIEQMLATFSVEKRR
jgi:hypothetical protein